MEEPVGMKLFRNEQAEQKAEVEFQRKAAAAVLNDALWAARPPVYKPNSTVLTTIFVTIDEENILERQVQAKVRKSIAGVYLISYVGEKGIIVPLVRKESELSSLD